MECWLSQAWSVFHALGIQENLSDFSASSFSLPFPPANIPKNSSSVRRPCMANFPKTKLTDDWTKPSFSSSVLPHPTGSMATPLPSTAGVMMKMDKMPSHPISATNSAFQTTSVSTVLAANCILGTQNTTNDCTPIKISEASTPPVLISLDISDSIRILSSPLAQVQTTQVDSKRSTTVRSIQILHFAPLTN